MEITKKNISFKELIAEKRSCFSETVETIIPDTYPDIFRIVSIDANSFIKDESLQKDRVLISGGAKAVLVYEAEEGNSLYKLPIALSFAHIEEIRGITNDSIINSEIYVTTCDPKIINSRKVMICANMMAKTNVYNSKNIEITEDISCDDKGFEVLKSQKSINVINNIEKSTFTVLDDIDITGLRDIINVSTNIKVLDTKVMPGKIIIRGEADIKTRYINNDDKIMVLNKTVPFSQMIDTENNLENADVLLCVKAIDSDIRGEDQVSVCITITAFITEKSNIDIDYIADMYHTEYMIEHKMQGYKINGDMPGVTNVFEENEIISVGNDVASIIDTNAVLESIEGDVPKISIACTVMYSDEAGKNYWISKKIMLNSVHLDGEIGGVSLNVVARAGGRDSIEIRILATINTIIKQSINILEADGIVILENQPKSRDKKLTLVLKNINSEENIWNIAKEYNAKMADIIEANELEPNASVVSNRLLLIPIS